MNEPLISVIVPVYNVEKYLRECLESIKNQTYKNLEIFLIDDGSTDQSGSICDHYSKIDPRFKTIHKQNAGLSATRNLGLTLINGDYVGFVDSDDVCEPNMYESLIEAARLHQADLTLGGMRFWRQHSFARRVLPPKVGLIDHEDMIRLIFSLPPWNKTAVCGGYVMPRLYARDVLQGLSFDEDKTTCEDELFVSQVLLRCQRIAVINKLIYRYRQRAGSLVNRPIFGIYLLKGRLKIADLYLCQDHLLRFVETAICSQVASLRNQWFILSERQKLFLTSWARDYFQFAKTQHYRRLISFKTLRKLWWLTQPRKFLELYMKFRSKHFRDRKKDFFP